MLTGVGIACSIIVVMIGTIFMTCVKLFSRIRPFHFAEHRTTAISLLFLIAITISTLIESVLVYIRIFPQTDINAFFFTNVAIVAFVCLWCLILPDIFSKTSAEDVNARFLTFFGRLCVGMALFFEILATIMFYLIWIHS